MMEEFVTIVHGQYEFAILHNIQFCTLHGKNRIGEIDNSSMDGFVNQSLVIITIDYRIADNKIRILVEYGIV